MSLSTAPSSNVTVTVSRTSGNTGLSVSSGGTLTFTPANFATAQTVTLAADSSSTGAATFSATASGYTTAAVSVTETSSSATGTLLVNPASFSVAQGTSDVFGVSLSSAPSGNVSVTVGRTAGNSGLAVSAGADADVHHQQLELPAAGDGHRGHLEHRKRHVHRERVRVPVGERDRHRDRGRAPPVPRRTW